MREGGEDASTATENKRKWAARDDGEEKKMAAQGVKVMHVLRAPSSLGRGLYGCGGSPCKPGVVLRHTADITSPCVSSMRQGDAIVGAAAAQPPIAPAKAATEAAKAREVKLADRDPKLVRAAAEQVTGRRCLEVLQREVPEAQDAHPKEVFEANTDLTAREEEGWATADAKAATDRVALSFLELRAHQALSSICKLWLEFPLIPEDNGYPVFYSELVKEFEGMAKKVDTILE
ncbi:hypothetical protein D1007_25406 [Hordeum vulgare]|nr:hypothetical protein D1007_25406 [Hordeum vulgare]